MSLPKINLLELSSSLGFGGTERAVVNNCKYITREFFNIYACGFREGGYREKNLNELGVEYLVAENSVEKLIKFIAEKKIHAINFHRSGKFDETEAMIIRETKKINPQIVILENNIFGQFDPVSYPYIDGSIFQSMMHVHERYLKQGKKLFDFNRHKVFYNMVDREGFEKYRLQGSNIKKYKQELSIHEEDFVIGKIARSHVAKWSDLILDMMPYLVKLVPNIKFIIIGVPQSRLKRIKKSSYKDNIIILPETTDESVIHRFYQTIDVLAHSSKIGECNGNTINEAMFWGKPVIVNSTPTKDNGQLEQVEHMVTGIIANTPQTYARAIEHMYRNSETRTEMGKNSITKVLEEYDPRHIAGMLEKYIIERLVSKKIDVPDELREHGEKIQYSPNEEEVKEYVRVYQERLKLDFGNLTWVEKIQNVCRVPAHIVHKVTDSLEGRYGIKL